MGTNGPDRPQQGDHPYRTTRNRSVRWAMGFSPPSDNSPIPALPSTLCDTPKLSNSSSTCRTSSPSPRDKEAGPDNGAVASSVFWAFRRPDGSPTSGVTSSPQQPASASPADTSWDRFEGLFDPRLSGRAGREPHQRKSAFRVFVVFRGGWCTASHSLLRGFTDLDAKIKRADGKVIALSSQTMEQVTMVKTELRLPFQVYGDPTNELVEELNRRFEMGCTVSKNDIVLDAYPKGMAQPCVLAVSTDDVQDQSSVLYKYSHSQAIGSLRYDLVWQDIERALKRKVDPTSAEFAAPARNVPPRSATPIPDRMPPRAPPTQRHNPSVPTRPRIPFDVSRPSTTVSSESRPQSTLPRFPSLRNHHTGGGGGSSKSGSSRQLVQPQPPPARRRWLFSGSSPRGIASFSDDNLPSASVSVPPTPGRHRGGRRSTPPTEYSPVELGTHPEEGEDGEGREGGENRDRVLDLPPSAAVPTMSHPAGRGMLGRSSRWSSSSNLTRPSTLVQPTPSTAPSQSGSMAPPRYEQLMWNVSNPSGQGHRDSDR